MFAAENARPAVQQASLALCMLNVKAAAPAVREKIVTFTGQTQAWLIQALGTLGTGIDVPLIAGYLNGSSSEMAAVAAIQQLTGVNFAPRPLGLNGYPSPDMLAARAWWDSHKAK